MVRPSYVLGGRAMEIVHEKSQLKNFVEEAFKAAEDNPILIDKFISHAMEVDVDAISDGKKYLLQVSCNTLKKRVFTLEILHVLYLHIY